MAALKFRICLVHAGGELSWSRDETELRRIMNSKNHLAAEFRDNAREKPLVQRNSGVIGDRLHIENEYSHMAYAYLRDHFCSLASAVRTCVK